ncbi:MAG TPA: amidase [Limnochordales bacterium]
MSREVLRELASAVARLHRVRIHVEQVERWAERLEESLAELELLLGLALPDEMPPAFEPAPLATPPQRVSPQAPSPHPAAARAPEAAGQPGLPAEPLSLVQAVRALRQGRMSAEELLERVLARIEDSRDLNAFIAVFPDEARQQARLRQQELKDGRAGLLAGIPLAVKDLMHIQGYAMTGGSRALDSPPAAEDAPALARLRAAGCVVVGAANLHELAYGVTSENPHFGPVRNPRDPERVAGGSSGGSAAALAAGLALAALGTDTGGSIRIPAACCGVVGLKPTFGRVSRRGVLPLSWSLDHVGPMALRVADVALLWAVMADSPGPEEAALARMLAGELPPHQATLPDAVRRAALAALGEASAEQAASAVTGLRVAVPQAGWLGSLDESVQQVWERVQRLLLGAGARLVTAEFPPMAYIRAAQFLILQAEATAVHRTRLYSCPDRLGPDVRLRLEIGEFLPAADYVQAQRLRRMVAEGFRRLFDDPGVELLLVPALPMPAPPLGARTVRVGSASEPVHRAMTRFTAPFNQSGLPALVVPAGQDPQGMPVGVQLVGPAGGELELFRAGMALEVLLQQG